VSLGQGANKKGGGAGGGGFSPIPKKKRGPCHKRENLGNFCGGWFGKKNKRALWVPTKAKGGGLFPEKRAFEHFRRPRKFSKKTKKKPDTGGFGRGTGGIFI